MKCTMISIDEQVVLEKIAEFEPDLIIMSESTFCLLKETSALELDISISSMQTNKIKGVTILFNPELPIGEFKMYKEIAD